MKERSRILATTCVVLLCSVLVWFNYSALLPTIAEEWGLTGTRAGVVFAAFQVGYLLAILPAGAIADQTSTRRVIAAGATGTGICSLGFALFANDFLSGSLLRLLAGICMAGVYVPGMRLVSEWYPEARRGRAMGIYVGAFSLSTGLSFFLSSAVDSVASWRVAIGVTSVGAVVAGPLMVAYTRDHPETTYADRRLDASVFRNRRYLYAVGVYTAHSWEIYAVRNWIPAFLLTVPAVVAASEPTLVAGLLAGVMMSVGVFGNLLAGWLSDHIGRIETITVALGSSTAITAGLVLLDWLSLPALLALMVFYGIVLTGDSAPTSTAITEIVDDENMGAALAAQSLVGFSATVVSPVAFGAALDSTGYLVAFLTVAGGAAVGLLFLGLLAVERRGKPSA